MAEEDARLSSEAPAAEPAPQSVNARPRTAFVWAGRAAMVLGATLGVAMAIIGCGETGGLFAAAAAGLLFAASRRTWPEAAVLAALAGLAGFGLAFLAFSGGRSVDSPEMMSSLATAFRSTLLRSLDSVESSRVKGAISVAATAGSVALAVGLAIRFVPHPRLARKIAAGLAVACVFAAMWVGVQTPEMSSALRVPHEAGAYRHDGEIYWHTYLKMAAGEGYYDALRDAAAGDRLLIDNGFLPAGQFTGWVYSPAMLRLPYSFYLWRFAAPSGGEALFVFAFLLAGLVLVGSLWALMPRVGPSAALVPLLLAPYLQMALSTGGLFMPDVWAGMLVTLGFFAWLREHYVVAGGLMLAAALCRETAIIALLIVLAWAIFRIMRKDPAWRVRAIAFGAMTAAFALAYWMHLRAGAPYIAGNQSDAGSIMELLSASAIRPLAAKFVQPAAYGSTIIAAVFVPAWLPVVLQFPGWFVALRTDHDALVPVMGYAAFWTVFTLVLGATSAYWGALYMPVAIAGTAAGLAWLGMRGQRGEPSLPVRVTP